jgi:hypothetical protein
MVIFGVPCPLTILAPVGTCHNKLMAPFTGVTEKATPCCPAHTAEGPLIVVGVFGAVVTAALLGSEAPQALLAITVTLPEVSEGGKVTAQVVGVGFV